MLLICLCLFAGSCLISLGACAALQRVSPRLGHVDEPGSEQHKAHGRPTPNTGGVAIFIAIFAPTTAAVAVAWLVPADAWEEPLTSLFRALRLETTTVIGVLGAILAFHLMGLADDRKGLSPPLKLTIQIGVCGALAAFFHLRIFEFLTAFGPVGTAASLVLSVLWLVAITNAMNMLDNMDGLAAGVGAIVAGFYVAATLISGQWIVSAACAILMGAVAGFLRFNWPPARLFMGDGGSLVLGLLLAVASVRTTYMKMPTPDMPPSAWYAALMPLVLLSVPLYDMASVTIIRLRHGHSPLRADRNHLSHRLVRLGLSKREAVLVIWLTTLATGIGGVMLPTLHDWQAILVAFQTTAVLAVLAALEWGRS